MVCITEELAFTKIVPKHCYPQSGDWVVVFLMLPSWVCSVVLGGGPGIFGICVMIHGVCLVILGVQFVLHVEVKTHVRWHLGMQMKTLGVMRQCTILLKISGV